MRFLPIGLLLLLSKLSFAAPLPAFEGTLTQTQNGATVTAKIAWQPPQTLLIEIPRDDATQTPAQTILTRGDETLFYEPASKRTHRYAFNVAQSWWRGSNLSSGGPANFLFAGTPFPAQNPENHVFHRDDVLLGGGGQSSYYAAVKSLAPRYAAQITVSSAARLEKDAAGKTTLDAKITLDGVGLPHVVQTTAAGETATFTYDLKATTATLTLPEIPTAVVEDDQLLAPSAYTGGDASALYNRGASLAENEDFPAAYSALGAASRQAPTASSPLLTTFELAMSLRDEELASVMMTKLEALNLDPLEILPRRARLMLLHRDNDGALAALKAASAAAPQNLALRLLEAQAMRNKSDVDGARAVYIGILAEKSPQLDAQITAAQTLAQTAMPADCAALIASIPAETDAQKLGRALLQFRSGQAPEATEFAADLFEIALAQGQETAAHDGEAQKLWQTLEQRGSDATKNQARSHLMTLAARRGDAAASIGYWRAWNATLSNPIDQDYARSAFFDAWQKAFRSDALQSVLSNRAAATVASEDDLRLQEAYLERFGAADDVTAAINTGLARFPNSAYWLGKRAEDKVAAANATRSTDPGLALREQLFAEAGRLLDQAIAAAPDEPFYRFQKALAATQHGAKTGALIDAGMASRNRAAAKKETAQLLADFPNDPDALVSAALQNLAFEGDNTAREAIRLATLALDTAPGDGDRHTLIWAARQALATAYRRLKQPDLAAQQWEMLLLGARSPGEQASLASSYYSLLETAGDSAGGAHLLTRIASEKWPYSGARASLDALALRIAASPTGPAIVKELAAASDPASALALATVTSKQAEVAQRQLQTPDAPPAADANLDRANRDLGLALGKLRGVADGPDRIMAARAAAFLAEGANLAGDERLGLLRRAIEVEPRDSALRFALIGALSGDESKKERELTAKILDPEPETQRQLSSAARNAGDVPLAIQLGEAALAGAARTPEIDTNTFQRIAFSLARSEFVGNQTSRALELYNGLSLAQWNNIDRAAAYLALSRNYKESGKDAEVAKITPKITALGLEAAEIDGALTFVDEVEN